MKKGTDPNKRMFIKSIDGKKPTAFFTEFEKAVKKRQQQIAITVNKKRLQHHVKKVCWLNLKKNSTICSKCPFRSIAIKTLKETGWPLPPKTR
jgi:hypothetical protein